MKRLALAGLCAALVACSSSEEAGSPPASQQDAAVETSSPEAASQDSETPSDGSSEASSNQDAAPADAFAEASLTEGGSSFDTCEGSCAQTSASINLGGKTATLERAQFGFNAPDKGASTLHIEAHIGGDAVCPSQSSPSPDVTVIFGTVPIPTDTTPIVNTPVTLLDFTGGLSSNPLDKATAATLTPVAIKADPPESAFFAFDVEVTFPNGTIKGHVYATHCDSMDE